MYIAGIDVGGTNTDAALIKDNVVLATGKVPTDHDNLVESTAAALAAILDVYQGSQPLELHLSTTLSTNIIVEGKGDPTAVLAVPGPGMRIEELGLGFPVHILSGSVDHRGREVAGINSHEVQAALAAAQKADMVALAVVGKFSHRNPTHELAIEGIAQQTNWGFRQITLGHRLSGRPNFPRRLATSYLNAGVARQQAVFVEMVKRLMIRGRNIGRVFLLKADGGTMTLDDSLARPVETILSGPAASLMGAQALTDYPAGNAVIVDIGGTTTDVSVQVGGEPVFQRQGAEIAGRRTLVPALFAQSIGLGGDSEVRVVSQPTEKGAAKLEIGPKRAGTPAALGGSKVTPTDAAVVLGLAKIGDIDRARKAVEELGAILDLEVEAAAQAIVERFTWQLVDKIQDVYRYLESRPVYTISELLAPPDIRPQVLIGLGGPARVFIPLAAEAMGVEWEVLPYYQEANAIGAAASRPTAAVTLHADTALGTITVPEMDYMDKIKRAMLFDLEKARAEAIRWAAQKGEDLGITSLDDIAIMDEESFNMVRGFHTVGRIFTIRAQVRPRVRRIAAGQEGGRD
ncbi:MAG: hydantoinase/oxoprolinase family protein [Firmicutes bacterium]|mgnify:FL=1|nr:hydantoinase/oxoprolinase family protein [Bacillota bacterium]